MPVKLNSSGGGSVTIDVPATGTATTLNLPISGGALVVGGPVTTSGLTMASSRLLGRTTAGSGAVEEISVGTGLTLTGGVLSGFAQPQLRDQLFISSGTWTAPAGVTRVQVLVIGGGGGGGPVGNAGSPFVGQDGGYGGVALGNVAVVPGTTYTVTVGGGGVGSNATAAGTSGGTSSFGTLISATGGAGGEASVGGRAANGTGINGTIRNGDISMFGFFGISPFNGGITRGNATSSTAAVIWSISSIFSPGAAGSGENEVCDDNGCTELADATGGFTGVVYIQWVG